VTTARPRLGAGQDVVNDLREAQADVYGDLLSTAQVCEVLGISRWTIRRLVQDEKLTTVKLRGRVYVRESVLRDYIAAQHDQARKHGDACGTAPQPRARKTSAASPWAASPRWPSWTPTRRTSSTPSPRC
jgi:excisionase family DNA binding protein